MVHPGAVELVGLLRVRPGTSSRMHRFRNMRRMDASLRKTRALRLRVSQSLASRRQRFNQANVRSTIQRLGNGTNPLTRSERLTISVLRFGRTLRAQYGRLIRRRRYRRTVLRETEIDRTAWPATRCRHRDPEHQRNERSRAATDLACRQEYAVSCP